MISAIKQNLVGTALGRLGSSARNFLELLRTPRVAYGTLVNDQLASTLMAQLCRADETFVDIGAHIGSVVAEVRYTCPSARIIAFEAIPEKVSKLRNKFPDVTFHSCALSEDEGEASFYIDLDKSGYSSLDGTHGNKREIRVEKRRLDSLLDVANMIKIDVEGAELGVLRGGEKLIARCRPIIMFESGPGNAMGYTKEQMFAWFASRDYGLFAPNRIAHTGGPMTLWGFLDSHEYPRRTTNYFAIPMERFDEVRAQAKALRS